MDTELYICLMQLERKYPNAKDEWAWQYVFPATKISTEQNQEYNADIIYTIP